MFSYYYLWCFIHNNAFWSNSNAFSLKEGEFRQLEIWTWKSYVWPPIQHNSKSAKTLRDFLWNIWGILEPISTKGVPLGGHNSPGRAREPRRALVGCAHPGPTPVPIFWYICHFDLENIRIWLSDQALPSRGGTWAGACLCSGGAIPPGELPSRRGKSSSSSSPTTLPSWGGQSHQHIQQHHLISNPSSSLVFNLCIRTIDWCLWLTSSVDYIL